MQAPRGQRRAKGSGNACDLLVVDHPPPIILSRDRSPAGRGQSQHGRGGTDVGLETATREPAGRGRGAHGTAPGYDREGDECARACSPPQKSENHMRGVVLVGACSRRRVHAFRQKKPTVGEVVGFERCSKGRARSVCFTSTS